jgi:hypothetical protein
MAALAPGSRPLPEAPLGELLENGSVLHYLARVVQALLRKGGRRESLPTLKLRSSGLGARSKTFADKADVDFFLRVCRDVGLTDVDLFTTSAVCGEASARDILRVCRSLRTLSVRLEDLRPGVFPPFSAGSRAAGMSTESTGKKASVFSGLGKPGAPGERAPAAAGATGEPAGSGEGGRAPTGALLGAAAFLGAALLAVLALGRQSGRVDVRESRHGEAGARRSGGRGEAFRRALNQPVPVVFREGSAFSSEKANRFTTVYQRPGEDAPAVVRRRFVMVKDE